MTEHIHDETCINRIAVGFLLTICIGMSIFLSSVFTWQIAKDSRQKEIREIYQQAKKAGAGRYVWNDDTRQPEWQWFDVLKNCPK